MRNKRLNSLLGLTFDGSRLEGVVLRRTNGSAEIVSTMGVTLSLNPLSHDPDLVGREIRQQLDAAEIRERRCVVCLPLNWTLTLQTKLPAISDEDLDDFLQLEAERGLASSPESLVMAKSLFQAGNGDRYVTQFGVPREQLQRLESVLLAAKLIPVVFSLGLPALQLPSATPSRAVAALSIGENGIGLQIISGGGVVALRTIDGALEVEGAEKRINPAVLAREVRITLGQLPSEIRSDIRVLRLFGVGPQVDEVGVELAPRLTSLGLTLERVTRYTPRELGIGLPVDAPVTPALSLAARHLVGPATPFDFLPPKVSAWQRFTAKYSARKLLYAGGAALFVALAVGALFAVQQVELSKLNSQWTRIAPSVNELETLQGEIKQFRSWYDDSFRSLSILRQLSQAFPEEGTVTAKTIEIRDTAPVICTGTAKDSQALYKVLDRLRAVSEISDLQLDQVRGNAPMQFSFNFHWGERSQQ